jgi:hypothetical protein
MTPDTPLDQSKSPTSRRDAGWARALTLVAAPLIVVGGYVHFCLYRHGYRSIPTIGAGFVLQFTSSAVIATALVLMRGAWHVGRHRVAVAQTARLSGVALTVGTLVALAIAHTSGGLFGFRETGLQPSPQTVITVFVEFDAAVLLAIAIGCSLLSGRRPAGDLNEGLRPEHLADAA